MLDRANPSPQRKAPATPIYVSMSEVTQLGWRCASQTSARFSAALRIEVWIRAAFSVLIVWLFFCFEVLLFHCSFKGITLACELYFTTCWWLGRLGHIKRKDEHTPSAKYKLRARDKVNWELRIENWELRIENWKLKIENWKLTKLCFV